MYKEIDPVNGLSLKTKEKPVPNLRRTKEKPVPKIRTKEKPVPKIRTKEKSVSKEENVDKEGIIARPKQKDPRTNRRVVNTK